MDRVKESKKTTVDRLSRKLREGLGLSRGKADEIAEAVVRSGRDLKVLALKKRWPLNEQGALEGSKGSMTFEEVKQLI